MNGDLNDSSKSPSTAKRLSVKKVRMQVALLDDTVVAFDVEPRAKGEELYKKVNTHLNLSEAEFFGLLFADDEENNVCWLDHLKPITKQVRDPAKVTFKFRVMFYTPDPNSLQEYTRYLFTLQVRRDLLDGRLHCSEDTGALLASYIVQGELGDHDPVVHKDGYLAGFQFVPSQTSDIEQKIVDYHKSHRGESPAESDHNMLEIARQLEMYGITLYPAQDSDNMQLHLAVYHLGITVLQNKRKINNFSWANIRKVSFKKKRFLVKLHRGVGTNNNEEVVSFTMQSRNASKTFWKVCVNHHVFFRQSSANTIKRQKSSLKRGSKYRYSGRTKQEINEENAVTFRSTSESDDKNRGTKPPSKIFAPSTSSAPDSPQSDNIPRYVNGHQPSEDEGSFSLASSSHGYSKLSESSNVEFEDDNFIAPALSTHNVITIKHQDTIDVFGSQEYAPPAYQDVVSEPDIVTKENVEVESVPLLEYDDEDFKLIDSSDMVDETSDPYTSALTFNTIGGLDVEADEGDDLSLDATVHVTSTDREIEDEVDSMFKMINSGSSWHYNISSVTTGDVKSDEETTEHSDTEDNINEEVCESTEVDADEALKTENYQMSSTMQSEKTEADEETEAQLREKVKGLTYLELQAEIEVT